MTMPFCISSVGVVPKLLKRVLELTYSSEGIDCDKLPSVVISAALRLEHFRSALVGGCAC